MTRISPLLSGAVWPSSISPSALSRKRQLSEQRRAISVAGAAWRVESVCATGQGWGVCLQTGRGRRWRREVAGGGGGESDRADGGRISRQKRGARTVGRRWSGQSADGGQVSRQTRTRSVGRRWPGQSAEAWDQVSRQTGQSADDGQISRQKRTRSVGRRWPGQSADVGQVSRQTVDRSVGRRRTGQSADGGQVSRQTACAGDTLGTDGSPPPVLQ